MIKKFCYIKIGLINFREKLLKLREFFYFEKSTSAKRIVLPVKSLFGPQTHTPPILQLIHSPCPIYFTNRDKNSGRSRGGKAESTKKKFRKGKEISKRENEGGRQRNGKIG